MTTRRRQDLLKLFASFSMLSLLGGCAKVADPRPPDVSVPAATTDLRLAQTGPDTTLSFPTPPAGIRTVLVYRQCGPEVDWEEVEPAAQAEVTALQAGEAGRLTFTLPTAGPDCRYAIRLESDRRRLSALSNVRPGSPVAAPLPPTNLRAEVHADRIVVAWDPPQQDVNGQPANVVAYLVNGKNLVSSPSFEDKSFQFGKASVYYTQAVSRTENPLTLSVKSQELTVTPVDTFGPAPPTTVSGLLTEGRVQLVWDASDAPDFKIYRVYRGTDPSAMQKIGETPTPVFTDEKPPSSSVIYYQVSGVDQLGNEGARSEPARVERPQP